MNERNRLYLRLFLYCGLPFGIVMGTFNAFSHGLLQGILLGLVNGVLFGGFMSLIVGSWHISAARKIAHNYDESVLDVVQEREVLLRLSYGEALDLCSRSIETVKSGWIVDVDPIKGLINAKSHMTWKRGGDRIRLELESVGNELVRINVSSRPLIWTNLVDNGSNLDNIQKITEFLETECELLTPASSDLRIDAEISPQNDRESERLVEKRGL